MAATATRVMLTLGIIAGLAAAAFGGFAVFLVTETFKSGGDWGGLTTLLALIFGAIALMWLLIALGFLISRRFVRRASRMACIAGITVTVLAACLPTAGLGILWAGNDPSIPVLCGFALGLALWLAPHAWIVLLLRQAVRDGSLRTDQP